MVDLVLSNRRKQSWLLTHDYIASCKETNHSHIAVSNHLNNYETVVLVVQTYKPQGFIKSMLSGGDHCICENHPHNQHSCMFMNIGSTLGYNIIPVLYKNLHLVQFTAFIVGRSIKLSQHGAEA